MLGSASNWSSMAKSLARKTGRKIIIFDARNHGKSGHADNMSYKDMSSDLVTLIKEEQKKNCNNAEDLESVILIGHSMGGRTCMYTALKHQDLVHSLIVVDISPINQKLVTGQRLFKRVGSNQLCVESPLPVVATIVQCALSVV